MQLKHSHENLIRTQHQMCEPGFSLNYYCIFFTSDAINFNYRTLNKASTTRHGTVSSVMMARLIGTVNLNNTDTLLSMLTLIERENRKNNFTRLICTSRSFNLILFYDR